MSICDNRMCLVCCGLMKEGNFRANVLLQFIYLLKLTNQVLIVLVPYHNILWVLYLDCTRGYLQFDMLVAIVSLRNNETCHF